MDPGKSSNGPGEIRLGAAAFSTGKSRPALSRVVQDAAFLQVKRALPQLSFPGVVHALVLDGQLTFDDKPSPAGALNACHQGIEQVRRSTALNLHLLFNLHL